MFHLYSTTAFMLIIILTVNDTRGHGGDDFSDKFISQVMPQKSDLIVYLKSLMRVIVDFCPKHMNELELNFGLGLFFANVNLKSVLRRKQGHIPKLIRIYIKLLLREIDRLKGFIQTTITQNRNSLRNDKMILPLISNEYIWIKKIREFKPANKERIEPYLLAKPFSSSEYISRVEQLDAYVPSPELSDECMASLANNIVRHSLHSRCDVYEPCYNMVVNGSDFGYALTHRLLFLLNARYSRGCSIFSVKQDTRLMNKICKTAYGEAKYIASNSYVTLDLMLEQMTLCALDGHAEFMRRDWLSDILQYQTAFGCFAESSPLDPDFKPKQHTIMDGACDLHLTSVATATLAAAIRYILEVYY